MNTISLGRSYLESFAQLPLFVISTKGRNLNRPELLRFLVAYAPRNDKIQRSHLEKIPMGILLGEAPAVIAGKINPSKPTKPYPLFSKFIKASLENKN